MSSTPPDLAKARAAIDALDRQLHALIQQRANLAHHVRRAKTEQTSLAAQANKPRWICPEREAQILRRLAEDHQSAFPLSSLVQIWRELIGGMIALEHAVTLAYCDAAGLDLATMARSHAGTITRLHHAEDSNELLALLLKDEVDAGLLPWPGNRPEQEGWWLKLLGTPLRISAALPFLSAESAQPQAALLASQPVFPSGDDLALIATEGEILNSPSPAQALDQRGGWTLYCVDLPIDQDLESLTHQLSQANADQPVQALGLFARPLKVSS